MSTFSGLSIGLSSLYAQRRGLELTGHNVANANTEGYSRQRVRLQGEGGPITPAMHSVHHGVGNGVSVVDTQRLWHVVVHPGDAPRYALITSFESGPTLDRWIDSQLPVRV